MNRSIFLLAPLMISIILIAWAYSVAGPPGFLTTGNLASDPGITGSLIEKPFIPSSHIQDMAYGSLMRAVEENRTALIFFYDSTCDSCILQIAEIESLLEHLNKTNPDIFKNFTYYEYDFNTGIREKFNVTGHHTLILIRRGMESLRTTETLMKDQIMEKITG
jgi:hypothetical protein